MPERINPWGPTQPEFVDWETYLEKRGDHPQVYRLRVPGGWLYRLAKSTSLTFVPE